MPRVVIAAVALVFMALVGCSDNTQPPTVASLDVAPDSIRMPRGDSVQLTVSALDQNGHLVTGIAIAFASSDTTIARVSATGLVRSQEGIGSASIQVSGGGVTHPIPVTVFAVAASIEVAPVDTAIPGGGSYTLQTTVFDGSHTPIPAAPLSFSSNDSSVATVSAAGLVTAKAAGSTGILVTSGAALATAGVTVLDSSLIARVRLDGSPFGTAATKPGIAYVLRHTSNSASRFDLPAATIAATFGVDDNPTFIAFDSSGSTAYVTAQFAGKVDVITVTSNSKTDEIGVTGAPFIVKVSPDNQSIWVSTNVDSLYQIDRTTKSVLARYGLPLVPNGLAFNPANDSLLYVSTLTAGSVIEINYKTHTFGRTFSTGGNTQAVAVSLDGLELYVANEWNSEVEVYNLASGAALTPISTPGGVFDLVLSPDGSTIWVTLSGLGRVQAYDRVSRQLQRDVFTGGAPRRIAVTPATTTVLVPNEYGWVDFIK